MHKYLIRSCKLIIVTSVIFIILTGSAMIAFPGGSLEDRNAVHYNFFANYLSDLGSTSTISGKLNTISNILFITALGSLGVVLIFFSGIWRAMDIGFGKFNLIGFLSNICLVASGLSFIGMAFTPWNKFFDSHALFVKSAFAFLLAWSILIAILQAGNVKLKKLLAVNIFFIIILGIYNYILFYVPMFGGDKDPEFHALAQKIIFFIFIINLSIQASGIYKFLRNSDFRKAAKNFYV